MLFSRTPTQKQSNHVKPVARVANSYISARIVVNCKTCACASAVGACKNVQNRLLGCEHIAKTLLDCTLIGGSCKEFKKTTRTSASQTWLKVTTVVVLSDDVLLCTIVVTHARLLRNCCSLLLCVTPNIICNGQVLRTNCTITTTVWTPHRLDTLYSKLWIEFTRHMHITRTIEATNTLDR